MVQERKDIPSTGNRKSEEREVHGACAGGLDILRRPWSSLHVTPLSPECCHQVLVSPLGPQGLVGSEPSKGTSSPNNTVCHHVPHSARGIIQRPHVASRGY